LRAEASSSPFANFPLLFSLLSFNSLPLPALYIGSPSFSPALSLLYEFRDKTITPEFHCAQSKPAKMTSYFSRLSPVPGFPEYTGPHKVGTIDVELPVSDLDPPSPSPDESISTVQYRIFYPCEPDAKGKKTVNWLPAPQRGYVSAYTKFLGAGSMLADFIS
jgi:hypothetical protein